MRQYGIEAAPVLKDFKPKQHEDVLDALNQDTTFFSAAAMLRVPMEMLDFKFRLMKWKGYKLMEPPIHANGDFMRNMEVPENADYYS